MFACEVQQQCVAGSRNHLRRLEEEIENLQGPIGALPIVTHQADDLRWPGKRRAKSRLTKWSAITCGGATLQLWSQLLEVGDQIGQQILGPKRLVGLQEIGDIDDRIVVCNDA